MKGPANVVLTSDASGLAGCEPGGYSVHGVDVLVEPTKRISLKDSPELLAGSAGSTLDCVNYIAKTCVSGTADAIDMAGVTAARVLGLEVGQLERGNRADFFLYHTSETNPIEIIGTVVAGAIRYSTG